MSLSSDPPSRVCQLVTFQFQSKQGAHFFSHDAGQQRSGLSAAPLSLFSFLSIQQIPGREAPSFFN
jgi:hypothetical protein